MMASWAQARVWASLIGQLEGGLFDVWYEWSLYYRIIDDLYDS